MCLPRPVRPMRDLSACAVRSARALLLDPLVWAVALLCLAVWLLPASGALFHALFPALERPVYLQEPFSELLWQHMTLVAVSSLAAVVVGTLAGVAITRTWGQSWAPMVEALAALGQTFPPVAVLAVAVPVVGFGEWPALIALALYGVLPVLQGTVAGLRAVPDSVHQAALAMGMSPLRTLWLLDMPLALPVWLAGVRSSVVIGIGTAAIASTVGAKTLGSPIIVGLSGFNTAYILQGALLVAALAVITDMAFERLARRVAWQA